MPKSFWVIVVWAVISVLALVFVIIFVRGNNLQNSLQKAADKLQNENYIVSSNIVTKRIHGGGEIMQDLTSIHTISGDDQDISNSWPGPNNSKQTSQMIRKDGRNTYILSTMDGPTYL